MTAEGTHFLDEDERRPWPLDAEALEPVGMWLGKGSNPLEVAVAHGERPAKSEIRRIWQERHGHRASPLMVLVLYPSGSTQRACACGPIGEDPPVVMDLAPDHVERIVTAALDEPDRHSASRFLLTALPSEDELPGIRNTGMFATHDLEHGLPSRPDWTEAVSAGRKAFGSEGQELVERLGFEIDQHGASTSLLRASGADRAIAIFLHDTEQPESGSSRFGHTTPVSHGLAAADARNLPYLVVTRGKQIRVYATSNIGVGRKGRAETFVEANLAALPEESAGYLPILFGAAALRPGGTFEEVLESSRDFATDLGRRLRERTYGSVVPLLAEAIAAEAEGAEQDLDSLYEQALVLLFRLLFIAYAEDKDLLPLRTSGPYERHALKTLARELAERRNGGAADFDQTATDLWEQVHQLSRAVDEGNADWHVPRYNGGLFSSDAGVSAAGAALESLVLRNDQFGPALEALLIDETVDGVYGPVDFRTLSVREFGTIYEGLLESSLTVAGADLTLDEDGNYVPAAVDEEVIVGAGAVYLHNRSGARKSTGSYFTKPFAVEHLLEQALRPAVLAHLEGVKELLDDDREAEARDRFFDFRCADIAMGSGHFLVAAVDEIESRFSSFLAEHPIPGVIAELERLKAAAHDALGDHAAGVDIEHSSLLRRQIARRCVYGVDANPIAVELARLALWIHTFVPGLPLSFLNHGLRHGDSLTGIGSVEDAVGIADPTSAPNATSLFREQILELLGRAEDALNKLGRTIDADAKEIASARAAHEEALAAIEPARDLFDLLCAERFEGFTRLEVFTEEAVASHHQLDEARETAQDLGALHFPVAFPEVFLRERPGFDCIIGNPPWDKVRFEEQQFWVTRWPGLNALGPTQREARMAELRLERPTDAELEEQERDDREWYRGYIALAYEHQGGTHYDYAKLFVERASGVLRTAGWLGYVLPRQCLVLKGWAPLRELLLKESTLRVVQARNGGGWIFDDVHHSYGVVLLTRGTPVDGLEGGALLWPVVKRPEEVAGLPDESARGYTAKDLGSLSDSPVMPWLEGEAAAELFDTIRKKPVISKDKAWLVSFHDARWDFRGTGPHKAYATRAAENGEWDILMTRHVLPYKIDRERAFTQFVKDPEALEKLPTYGVVDDGGAALGATHPLIVFRHPSRNDDARTLIAAALPYRGEIHNKGYAHALRHDIQADLVDQLALLAYINSYICDWWARRFVDRHVTAPVINNLRVPEWTRETRAEVAEYASELLRRRGAERLAGGHELKPLESLTKATDDDLIVSIERLVADAFEVDGARMKVVLDDFSDRGCPADLRARLLAEAVA